MASKITIKRSLTAAAPAGLSFGEMAFVQGSGNTAEQLYVGISGGNPVWVGARVENTVTDWDSKTRLATQFATVAKINSLITSNTAGVASFNGLTGAVNGITAGGINTFTKLNTFSAGISASGGTFASDITINSMTVGLGGGGSYTNVAVGGLAFQQNTTGIENVAVGYNALTQNTTAIQNVAVGNAALASNTTGSNNAAVGNSALSSNTTGSGNVGVGQSALNTNSSGIDNIAVGEYALNLNETGSDNIGVGKYAIRSNTTGSGNVGVGRDALFNNITGSNKTAIGYYSGALRGTGFDYLTTGTGGIYIGYQARGSADTQTNEIVIGVDALGLGSHTAVIGATLQSAATIYGLLNLPGGLSTTGATFTGNISAPNIVSSFNGLTGAVSGVGSIVAGTGISISGATGAVTVNSVLALATTGVTGVASFNSADFAVSGAGDVTIKAAGVGNAQLENPNITINGATIALGVTYNFKISEFGSASSAELSAKVSDATGTTGGFVRAIGPTISAPVISSDTIKNSLGIAAAIPILGTMSAVGAGDTFVLLTNTQTLTNKTLSGVTLGTPLSGNLTNCTFPTLNQNTTGSAAKLTTPVNINGTAFDGSANVTVTAAANTLTGATLASNVLASSLTSVGTISSGTWQGTAIGSAYVTTLNQNTTGSAAKLTTPVNINGTAFDGSANVTVTAAANTLTGATLASNVLASSLTSVGTLGSLSITGDLTVGGTFTVNGTVTTINSTTLTVDDKNIELGSVADPNNTTAADGGITLKGATDKTLKWLNSGAFAWTSSENFDLVSTKAYYIAGASVLNATTLGTLVVNSSLTSVGILTSLTVSGTLEAGLIDGGTF